MKKIVSLILAVCTCFSIATTFTSCKHKHKAKKFKDEMAQKVDLVVCMTREHKSRLTVTNAYTVGEITGRGDVPDPYGYPVEAYIKVAKYLCECVEPIFDAVDYLREKKKEKE